MTLWATAAEEEEEDESRRERERARARVCVCWGVTRLVVAAMAGKGGPCMLTSKGAIRPKHSDATLWMPDTL